MAKVKYVTRSEIFRWECNGVGVNSVYKRITEGPHSGALICPHCGRVCHELYKGAYELWCEFCRVSPQQLSIFPEGGNQREQP